MAKSCHSATGGTRCLAARGLNNGPRHTRMGVPTVLCVGSFPGWRFAVSGETALVLFHRRLSCTGRGGMLTSKSLSTDVAYPVLTWQHDMQTAPDMHVPTERKILWGARLPCRHRDWMAKLARFHFRMVVVKSWSHRMERSFPFHLTTAMEVMTSSWGSKSHGQSWMPAMGLKASGYELVGVLGDVLAMVVRSGARIWRWAARAWRSFCIVNVKSSCRPLPLIPTSLKASRGNQVLQGRQERATANPSTRIRTIQPSIPAVPHALRLEAGPKGKNHLMITNLHTAVVHGLC